MSNKAIKEMLERRLFNQGDTKDSCHYRFIKVRREANSEPMQAFLLTARQYGEVVLPEVSTGQGTGTPRQRGRKTVTMQGGYGALFAVRVQILLSITSVALQC